MASLGYIEPSIVLNNLEVLEELKQDGEELTTQWVGTASTGVTATEYGNGRDHVTVLTLDSAFALPSVPGGAAAATGRALYEFPENAAIEVKSVLLKVGLTDSVHAIDAPEIGVGTAIGAGIVATLDLSGGGDSENMLIGTASTAMDGTVVIATQATGLMIGLTANEIAYLNIADAAFQAGAGAATAAGSVTIAWSYLGSNV